jgi:hypothetical protein
LKIKQILQIINLKKKSFNMQYLLCNPVSTETELVSILDQMGLGKWCNTFSVTYLNDKTLNVIAREMKETE